MYLKLLAQYQQLTEAFWPLWESAKQVVRTWLGPAPQTWWLLADGRVLPSTIGLPDSVLQSACIYAPDTQQISPAVSTTAEQRFRRLPYLSVILTHESVGSVDVSDWVHGIRGIGRAQDLPLKQLLHLYGLANNQYVPISGATVRVVKNDGEEETHTYE